MALNHQQIQERINNIKKHSDYDSQFYGKLVNWYSHSAWHYGIGLSNNYLFDLGENLNTFHKGDRQIKLVNVKQFSPHKTIQRLIHSLDCFKNWNYGLLGWNCEHYSYLIATNQAISYQVKNSPLAFLNHGGYHPTSVQMLTQYLEEIGLSELNFFEENEILSTHLPKIIQEQKNVELASNFSLQGLLENIIHDLCEEDRKKREEKIQAIDSISDVQIRDSYIKQILLDRFLFISDNAKQKIQNIAKHAHYMAEVVNYYHKDHGANQEEAREISRQFRVLAIKITDAQSLYDLKFVYQTITMFSHHLSIFKHKEQKYSWEREIRKGLLEPLGDFISRQENFYEKQ